MYAYMKYALITGSSSGIGAATAKLLARRGFTVFVHYNTNQQSAKTITEEITQEGGSAYLVQADVSNEDAVTQLFATIKEKTDVLHVVINNAGVGMLQPIENADEKTWDNIFDVNVKGKMLCIKAALPLLKNAAGASIINISSRMAERPFMHGVAAYGSSQAAVRMLSKAAAKELAPYNIRVNTVSPGSTKTKLTETIKGEVSWETLAAQNPSGRIAEPEDIAHTIAFLVSEEAQHINGANIAVDGGSTL